MTVLQHHPRPVRPPTHRASTITVCLAVVAIGLAWRDPGIHLVAIAITSILVLALAAQRWRTARFNARHRFEHFDDVFRRFRD